MGCRKESVESGRIKEAKSQRREEGELEAEVRTWRNLPQVSRVPEMLPWLWVPDSQSPQKLKACLCYLLVYFVSFIRDSLWHLGGLTKIHQCTSKTGETTWKFSAFGFHLKTGHIKKKIQYFARRLMRTPFGPVANLSEYR